jgi:signal transduction histidine kinase
MSNPLTFRPRARLILQLGDQLIKNESIAILELVKNSYDAGATIVNIEMKNLLDQKNGYITIDDDGCGMDLDIIKNVWLEPGSDYKEKILNNFDAEIAPLGRRPLGEKGIGRFSAHKLGKEVELITRMRGKKEVVVKIKWNEFEKNKYIDQVPIDIKEREPELFKGKYAGTRIKISSLRSHQWEDNILKEIYRSINALSSPFETIDSFRVFLNTDRQSLFDEIPTIDDLNNLALYKFSCTLEKDKIVSFKYEFKPYASMDKLKSRVLTHNISKHNDNIDNFSAIEKMVGKAVRNSKKGKKESPTIDLSADKMEIGQVRFEGLIFDRQSKVLKYAHTETSTLRKYLDQNGGVRIYRDGVRVYDYGEPENDWLGLEKKRLYDPGVRLNKSLLIGAIHLDREASASLIEKTNREGFVDDNAYKTLRDAITYVIKQIEVFRNKDKDDVRLYYGSSSKSEPILANISDLKDIIETKIKDESLQKLCVSYLDKIEDDYKTINETLLTSAEAGLNLSVALHEFQKLASELRLAVKEEKSPSRIIKLIEHLSELIEMYATLVRKSKKKTEDLKTLIKDTLFNVHYRLKAHKVNIIDDFSNYKGSTEIQCSSRLVIGSILNLIDNSIYWLERTAHEKKSIIISLSSSSIKYLELLIADNGPGFALPPDQLIKPFVSMKPGGIGLGLHIANEVLVSHGGEMQFPKYSETELPREFKHGALIVLRFRRRT